jgi:uncharacterized membrane protein
VDLEQVLAATHILAAFSALAAGAVVLLLRKGTHRHRAIGTWSYAGLVAAGGGQLTVALAQDVGAWAVPSLRRNT